MITPHIHLAYHSVIKHGWVEVICGGMFSGKTEELIRRVTRATIAKLNVKIFKPSLDKRYHPHRIVSHSSQMLQAILVEKSEEIFNLLEESTQLVALDEVQFFDMGIIDVSQRLAERGLRVILAGLDVDYQGLPFGPMPELLALSEYVTKLSAVCVECGGPACRSQLKKNIDIPGEVRQRANKKLLIGSHEYYEARCRACFDPHISAT